MNADKLVDLIRSELKPGRGCTEPAAIGLAVSNTCVHLGEPPEQIRLRLSSSIFKNAFCVKLPGTDRAGVPLAAALGCVLAKPGNDLELFAAIGEAQLREAEALLARGLVEVEVESSARLLIEVAARGAAHTARTLTLDRHDKLVYAERDGAALFDRRGHAEERTGGGEDITALSVRQLVAFAEAVDLDKIRFLREAVEMNLAMSEEGLRSEYGLGVGRRLREMVTRGLLADDLVSRVKIATAAASDCRMGGGQFSAMTVLGSGNQGFQAILPVAVAAAELGLGEEALLRAVAMSLLIAMHMKYQVGRLSPICGAQLTGAAASAAVTWLLGGDAGRIDGAIQNMLGGISGMVCDGAKDGCALKLAVCAGEAVLCAYMAMSGCIVQPTDGVVCHAVEDSIGNVADLSKHGMAAVNETLIDMLLHKPLSRR